MKRSGARARHVATYSSGPLSTPMMFRRSTISSVCVINSSSVVGDHTGSGHGGSLNIARNTASYGSAGSHAGIGSIGVHMPSGGGPWASTGNA